MAEDGALRRGWQRLRVGEPVGPDLEAEPEPEAAPEPREVGTFIGAGADFEGTLSLRGDFQIDSEFRGALETDGTITVGLQGTVQGDIRAREVVIRGAVVGDVHARRQLVLEAGGRLHGDVETACLQIEKHAFFQGRTAMTRPQAATRATAVPASRPEPAV